MVVAVVVFVVVDDEDDVDDDDDDDYDHDDDDYYYYYFESNAPDHNFLSERMDPLCGNNFQELYFSLQMPALLRMCMNY